MTNADVSNRGCIVLSIGPCNYGQELLWLCYTISIHANIVDFYQLCNQVSYFVMQMSWLDLNSDTCIVWYVNEFYQNVQLWKYAITFFDLNIYSNLDMPSNLFKWFILNICIRKYATKITRFLSVHTSLIQWKHLGGGYKNADEPRLSCHLIFAT